MMLHFADVLFRHCNTSGERFDIAADVREIYQDIAELLDFFLDSFKVDLESFYIGPECPKHGYAAEND